MIHRVFKVALAVASVFPKNAFACPACAMNDKGGSGSLFVMAGMILTPFLVVGTAALLIRKLTVTRCPPNREMTGDMPSLGSTKA